jgi:CDP-paratose 2-epimerase
MQQPHMNENILITGGCGFVGSNLALKLKNDFPSCKITALDNLKRRGSELNIPRLRNAGVEFIHGDIRNKEDLETAGETTLVIEAAAEPSVLSGINSTPDYVLNTNLIGTINCLNFAVKNSARFIFLSTSRVYPIAALNMINYDASETRFLIRSQQEIEGISLNGISEKFPLAGARSFYGTSKLSSELLIQEYNEFYGLKSVVNRCGVITGPWQMGKVDQGVVVLWLARHFWKKELSYIGFGGQGKQVRDILHIHDLYSLLLMQLSDFDRHNGETYNIGGGSDISVSLKELTELCEDIIGSKTVISSVVENRSADLPVYISDNAKITERTGWKPKYDQRKIVEDIFYWMKENEALLKPFLN